MAIWTNIPASEDYYAKVFLFLFMFYSDGQDPSHLKSTLTF